jgi:titin
VEGDAILGNAHAGVFVGSYGASYDMIGGSFPDVRNLISGNAVAGIIIVAGSSSNTVAGNYIGTDSSGTMAVGNGVGVIVEDSPNNAIGGPDSVLRNLISGNLDEGVSIQGQGATGNVVQGNYIGTDVSGMAMLGDASGVVIRDASHNTIGGMGPGEGNLITGESGDGIDIIGPGSTDNLVVGNDLGTTVSGLTRIGGGSSGICLIDSSNNQVGGTIPAARNVISGFPGSGLVITGEAATGNRVQGNLIGTDSTGTAPLGNRRDGITISKGASGNMIGGTAAGAANVIAFNGTGGAGSGVAVTSGTGNVILSNRIYANAGPAIALGFGTGAPVVDAPRAPVLRSASLSGGRLTIRGELFASPRTRVLVQFFLSDPTNPGLKSTLLGGATVATGPAGRGRLLAVVGARRSHGLSVSATATVPRLGTSPYSAGVLVTRS